MALAKVTFHPGASEDYAAAYSWYHDRGAALAANFESEIDRGVRLISQNPLLKSLAPETPSQKTFAPENFIDKMRSRDT